MDRIDENIYAISPSHSSEIESFFCRSIDARLIIQLHLTLLTLLTFRYFSINTTCGDE